MGWVGKIGGGGGGAGWGGGFVRVGQVSQGGGREWPDGGRVGWVGQARTPMGRRGQPGRRHVGLPRQEVEEGSAGGAGVWVGHAWRT
eukprot:7388379-Prymnesium_polylepis.2